jgi:hypothetical protein
MQYTKRKNTRTLLEINVAFPKKNSAIGFVIVMVCLTEVMFLKNLLKTFSIL